MAACVWVCVRVWVRVCVRVGVIACQLHARKQQKFPFSSENFITTKGFSINMQCDPQLGFKLEINEEILKILNS